MNKISLLVLILLIITATYGWSAPFKNNRNGTVTDLATGLTWQREDDNGLWRNNAAAADYCQRRLKLAGGNWRLPTIKELQSIVDYRFYGPAINSDAFPNTNLSIYWSASIHYKSSVPSDDYKWHVNFNNGEIQSSESITPHYVRCVR